MHACFALGRTSPFGQRNKQSKNSLGIEKYKRDDTFSLAALKWVYTVGFRKGRGVEKKVRKGGSGGYEKEEEGLSPTAEMKEEAAAYVETTPWDCQIFKEMQARDFFN